MEEEPVPIAMTPSRVLILVASAATLAVSATAQVIEFESGGLRYRTLTRRGVTVMFAQLPSTVREYSIVQVAVSNGSERKATIQPTSFEFHLSDGAVVRAAGPELVIRELMERGNRDDVVKLVSAYEAGLYGIVRFRSTNGFEQRRQAALSESVNPRLKAAAAASAIVLVETTLKPGESTDGVIFLPTEGKPLGEGYLVGRAAGEVFDFQFEPAGPTLQTR